MLGYNSTLGFLLSFGLISPKIIVDTEFGKLEGTSSTGRDSRTIYEFLGIPYAIPPSGDLRFRPPVPWNTTWDGVRRATKYGDMCTQFHLVGKLRLGKEDCLFLNVYTHRYRKPEDSSDNGIENGKLSPLSPVVVYFHGGLFMHGSADIYKPLYLLDSDIVLVTVNYRLGILGFLNLDDEDILGNQGLKDQVLALKWVQRNIANFGGNPNLVTIMGQSAGGVSVHYHMLSPLSRGLFHRAISQSGTAFVSWASQDKPETQAHLLATKLGCIKPSNREIAKCLRNLDFDKIAKSQRSASDILHDRYALYAPTIETPSESAFLSDLPQNIIKSGNFSKVPWLVGMNSEEGLIYSGPILRNDTIREEMNKNWTAWTPTLFRFLDEPNKIEIAEKIREYYLGNSSAEISMDTLHNITTFLSDRSFFEGLHNSLVLHRGQHPIYPYIYAYEGKFSFAKVLFGMTFSIPPVADIVVTRSWKWFTSNVLRMTEPCYGVAHGDDLPLLFKLPLQTELKEKHKAYGDYNISNILVTTWGGFAKDGIPPSINNISWPLLSMINSSNEVENINMTGTVTEASQQMDSGPIQFLKINTTIEIIDEPFHARASFWRKLNLLPYKTASATSDGDCNSNDLDSNLSCNKSNEEDDTDDNVINDNDDSEKVNSEII